MARRGKIFELLDFPKFAAPSVFHLDAALTATSLSTRLSGGASFMSYEAIWASMPAIVNGFADDAFIKRELSGYPEDWKNHTIHEATRLLRDQFGGRGKWYPHSRKPMHVLGFWFKPSIKGVWYVDGQAHAVMINARKGQHLSTDDRRFLARGIYELHCVDDPADPIPMIVDVSEPNIGLGRKLRVHTVTPDAAISLDQFDVILREFVKALKLAGVPVPEASEGDIVSLFKQR